MIWHIVRKDLSLLWPMAVIVAAVNLMNAVLLSVGGTFARTRQLIEPGTLSWISNLALPAVGLIGLVLLVFSSIQQDPLPGTTQDWLTRPIPRSRLWAAKFLFVLFAGLSPIFLGDVAMGVAAHFDPADVIAASLTRSLALLCLICAPAAMLALVTRKLTEILVFGIGLILVLVAVLIGLIRLGLQAPVMQSGYVWVVLWIFAGLSIVLTVLLVPLQLRWRSTQRVRWILLIVGGLVPMIFFIPWNAAIRLQQALAGHGRSTLAINPDDGRQVGFQEIDIGTPKSKWIWLTVPVTIGGTGANERVYVDRAVIRVTGSAGRDIYYGDSASRVGGMPDPNGFLLPQEVGNRGKGPEINLPVSAEIFDAARSAHAMIEVDLNLTEFALSTEQPLGSLTRDFPDTHTRCGERRVNGSGDMAVDCVSTREISECFEIQEPTVAAKRRVSQCGHGSYAPWPLPIWRDAYYSVLYGAGAAWINSEFSLMGADRSVQWSSLLLKSYTPTVHMTRRLSFPIDSAVEKSKAESAHSIDGVGAAARFASPDGAVVDQRGNLFIVDRADSVIRRVTPTGEVSTFAGTPRQVGRDDGSGHDARFSQPRGIGIDSRDNLYVADTGNRLIRKITPAALVSTVMTVERLTSPVAVVPAGDGALYVIDCDDTTANGTVAVVKKIAPNGIVSDVAGPRTVGQQTSP
jgi:hypothetical protein